MHWTKILLNQQPLRVDMLPNSSRSRWKIATHQLTDSKYTTGHPPSAIIQQPIRMSSKKIPQVLLTKPTAFI